MSHILSLDEIQLENAWLTIGIFDGVHLGHQELLKRLVTGAHQENQPAIVLTFHPHPAILLGGNKEFKLLTTPAERAALLDSLGVDIVITQPFDQAFADQTAEEFMQRLRERLGLRHLVIGYDTALGRGRTGDAARLTQLGSELGFLVEAVQPVHSAEGILSSGNIRKLIQAGDVGAAAQCLGRPYSIAGAVVHGDGRGHHINLPTANIDYPPDKLIPANGIYATWVRVQGEKLRGATNIGTNPTFTPDRQTASLETHILDLDRDLYDQVLTLEFVSRLREERKYTSVEELLRQIQIDIAQTRSVLK